MPLGDFSELAEEAKRRDKNPPQIDWKAALIEARENFEPSLNAFIDDFVNMAVHPVDTLDNVGNIVAGIITCVIPGRQGSEKYAEAVWEYIKSRYSGEKEFANAVAKDPVGVLADILTVATATTALCKGGAKLAGYLSKVAAATGGVETAAVVAKDIGALGALKTAKFNRLNMVNLVNVNKMVVGAVKLDNALKPRSVGRFALMSEAMSESVAFRPSLSPAHRQALAKAGLLDGNGNVKCGGSWRPHGDDVVLVSFEKGAPEARLVSEEAFRRDFRYHNENGRTICSPLKNGAFAVPSEQVGLLSGESAEVIKFMERSGQLVTKDGKTFVVGVDSAKAELKAGTSLVIDPSSLEMARNGVSAPLDACVVETKKLYPYGNAPFEKIGDAGLDIFGKPATNALGREAGDMAAPAAAMSY